MAKKSSVSISGTFRNFGHGSGFTTSQLMSEPIDDSISAMINKPVKIIRITLFQRDGKYKIVFSDSGKGMNKDEMEDAHVLNNVSESSAEKHGCFGAGRKHAIIGLSDRNLIKTLSRYDENPDEESSGIAEFDMDVAKIIRTSDFPMTAHDITVITVKLWEKYAIDLEKTGTVTIIDTTKKIFDEVLKGIQSNNIHDSYLYKWATTYADDIQSGLRIEIQTDIDGTIRKKQVVALQPLMWDSITDNYKLDIIMESYKMPDSENHCWVYKEGDKWYMPPPTNKHKKPIAIDGYKPIGINQVKLRSTYSENWSEVCDPIIENLGLNIEESNGSLEDYNKSQCGTFIKRNGKIISHYKPITKSSGDLSTRKIMDNARYEVSFSANTIIDNVFKVNVNKSRVDEEGIDSELMRTMRFLQKKFIKQIEEEKYSEKPPIIEPTIESVPNSAPTQKVESFNKKKTTTATEPNQNSSVVISIKPPSASNKLTATMQSSKGPAPKAPALKLKKPNTLLQSVNQTSVPAQAHATVINEPKTPIAPIVKPPLNVVFSKTETHMLVNHSNEIKARIPYTGQYNITEKYYNEIITKLGEERFLEWIIGRSKLVNEYDSKYFS